MASHPQTLLILLPFLVLSSVGAHNITQILESFSSFSTFNNYLTQTKVADEINHRQTISVLVVDDSKMSAISSYPTEVLTNIMSIHVILDYYDTNKLSHLPHKSAILTTLFQASGVANNKLGFLNVTSMPNDAVVFGSATPDAPLSSTFTKVVVTKPYNISVLQISDLIIPPGIDGAKQASPPTTSKPKNSTAHAPAPATTGKSPASAPTEAPEASDNAPADAPEASDNAPADAPKTSDNAPADAVEAAAPGASDTPPSSASRTVVNAILGLLLGVIYLGAF